MQLPGVALNIIGHSLGSGVLLHALNHVGQIHPNLIEHAFFWQAAIPNDALSDRANTTPPSPDNPESLWYCPHAYRAARSITVLYSKNDNVLGKLLSSKEQVESLSLHEVWNKKPFKEELLPALLLDSFQLESLYSIASWLGESVTDILQESVLAKVWQYFHTTYPTVRVPNSPLVLTTQPTLFEQRRLLASHGLGMRNWDECLQRLHRGCETVRSLISERYKHIKDWDATMLYMVPGSSKIVVSLLEIIVAAAGTAAIVLDHFFADSKSHILNLIAFAETKMMVDDFQSRPAMGYEGVDRKDPSLIRMIDSNKIKSVNTTTWIWHHSDMKIASQDVMDEIYKKEIIETIKFGKYKNKL